MISHTSMEDLTEAADLLIEAKRVADQIEDPELSRIVAEALMRVGKMLAGKLLLSSALDEAH